MKIMRTLVLTILLTACQSSWLTALVAQPGQPIFHDDFSDPGSGWPRMSSTNGFMGYDGGSFKMMVQAPQYDLQAVTGKTYRDAQIEVDATLKSGPVYNRFGLICRYQDMNAFYFFAVSSDGYYAIGKLFNGVTSLLGQEMMAYSALILKGNNTNHLRFDCVGNTLKGYVNGQILAIAQDTDFSSGDAGLMSGSFDEGGVEMNFDNFVVIKP
jgi:pectate lyase